MIVKKRLLAPFVVLLLLTAGVATSCPLVAAQTSGASIHSSLYSSDGTTSAKLDQYMTTLTDVGQFSGAVLVAQNGTVLLSKGYGMANYASCVPNTPQTVFPIASNTKQFTAAAVMKLQEQGRLNVTDPITKYIPDAPSQWKDIKVYQLMNFTSGMPREGGYDVTDPTNIALPDLVHRFYTVPLDFAPGTNESYSNNGYIVLSYIIEQASGQSFDQYLRQNIFQPLGMTSTGLANGYAPVPGRASGYTTEAGSLIDYDLQNIPNTYGAGAIYSTLGDLYKWEQAFNTPGGILSSTSVNAMLEHSYGVSKASFDNRTVIAFSGHNFGYWSQTAYFPNDNVTIVVLSNFERTQLQSLSKDLIAIVFGEPYSLPQKIDRHETPLNSSALQQYVGTYELAPGFNYIVFQCGAQLFYTASVPTETVKLFHESNDTFFVTRESPDSFTFTRDNSGKVEGLNLTVAGATDRVVKVS
ncbi:MAG: serine hydrolase [Halobacteriota archaeon]